MSDVELKSCPFCGSDAEEVSPSSPVSLVRCSGYCATSAASMSRKDWNTRISTSADRLNRAVADLLGFLKVTPLRLNNDDNVTYSMLISAVEAALLPSTSADIREKSAEQRLQKIRRIADLGSAQELDDAMDRLELIVKIAG